MAVPRRRTPSQAVPEAIAHKWPYADEELLKSLPPILRAVVKALGFGRAQDWLHIYGGINITVPKYRQQALDLGADELARLRHTLAPHMDATGRVTMPKADKLFIRVRDAQIRKDRHGASISALARRNQLSSRQIINICRETDDRQYDLF